MYTGLRETNVKPPPTVPQGLVTPVFGIAQPLTSLIARSLVLTCVPPLVPLVLPNRACGAEEGSKGEGEGLLAAELGSGTLTADPGTRTRLPLISNAGVVSAI